MDSIRRHYRRGKILEIERESQDLLLELKDSDTAEGVKALTENLVRYVESFVGPSQFKELLMTYKNPQGELVAGLHGQSNWQWLFVQRVWVAENQRFKGLGSKLMKAAEQEALRRGLRGVWLDTFSFQSPDFYKKLGYSEFGAIDDYPFGHKRHFFFKRL